MSVHVLHSTPDLAGEADHRIANSLATLSGLVRVRASAMSASDDPKMFLLEIADRIETVASLHRLMTKAEDNKIHIATYLNQVCDKLVRALAPPKTSINISSSSDHVLPFKVALPLGVITGELFSNSLKYAHPTGLPSTVMIVFDSDADGIRMIYEDDGVGFPEGFDFLHDGSLGLRFIRSLVGQLGGVHEWRSDPLGVHFELRVPGAALDGATNVVHGKFPNSQRDASAGPVN